MSYPCKIGVRAILNTLPYKIKADAENEIYRKYMARCARLITENTAGIAEGKFISVEYEDIIDPKPKENYEKGEIANKIKAKLR